MNELIVTVAFGLSAVVAEELIGLTQGSDSEPLRWLVFGADMTGLSALNTHWGAFIDLTIILIPGSGEDVAEAAMTILDAEAVDASRCVWIHGAGVPLSNDAGFGAVIDARGKDARMIASEISRRLALNNQNIQPKDSAQP